MKRFFFIIAAGLCLQHGYSAETVTIFSDEDKSPGQKSGVDIVGPLRFAALDIAKGLKVYNPTYTVEHKPLSDLTAGFAGKKIVIALKSNTAVLNMLTAQGGTALPALETQAYNTQTTGGGTSHWVFGGDDRGAMYGGLQLAEELQFEPFTTVQNSTVSPHIMARGTKINVAFDYRLPTYAGRNDTATKSIARAIEQVWQIDFWKTWIDEQARNRVNVLSVWNYNPFPALVDVPGFEKSTLPHIIGMGSKFDSNGTADGYKSETVPGVPEWEDTKLTLPERQKFWREVMLHAKKRGFDFYLFNWNVNLAWVDNPAFNYGVSKGWEDPKSMNNPADKAYLSAAIEKLYADYPDLSGFGVSPGEQLVGDSPVLCKWLYDAYSPGVVKACIRAKTEQPGRKIGFIHRNLQVDASDVAPLWKNVIADNKNLQFDMSLKYCRAYTYSTETPEWAIKDMINVAEAGMSTFLTLRNDGFYYPDFGDANFVRKFLANLPSRKYDGVDIEAVDQQQYEGKVIPGRNDIKGQERLRGFYFGHDTYTPTTSYLYVDPDLNNDPATGKPMYEFQRKWLSEMLWGRIGYDKDVKDEVFARGIEKRFPTLAKSDYPNLFSAWAKATQVHTKLTELVMNNWHFDSFFHTEFCMFKNGGEDIFRKIWMFYKDDPKSKPAPYPADGSNSQMASVQETGKGNPKGKPKTSWTVTKILIDNGTDALNLLATIPPSSDKRFNALMKMIQSQACLSLYYGYKVRGATFMAQGETVQANKDLARPEMYKAWGWWTHYIATMKSLYIAEDFRTYGLATLGWNGWDLEVKKEYTDLGGTDALVLPKIPEYKASTTPVITTTALPNGTVNVDYAFTILASGSPTLYESTTLPAGLILNKDTGAITGKPTAATTVPFKITVTASNTLGKGTPADLFITINPAATVNTAPTISVIADASTNEDVNYGPVNFTVGDAETLGSLTVTATSSNQTVVPNANIVLGGSGAGRTIAVTPALNQNGPVNITVTVSDGSLTATDVFVLTVTAVNDAPVKSTAVLIADQTAQVSNVFKGYTIPLKSFTDVEGTTLTWSAAPLPAGITFTPGTRKFEGTPTAVGETTVVVTVSDGSATATDDFKFTVTSGPVVQTPTPGTKPTVTNGTTTTPTISGTAPAGSTVTIYDGTDILTTLVVGSGGTWTYTVTPPLAAGSHTITYTITEPGKTESDKSPSETITVTVTPVVTPTPTTKPTVTNGTTTTPTISGTATVGSTVTIYNGTAILGTVVVGSSGTWTYTVTPPLAAGTYTITYTVTETGKTESGKSPSETITVSGGTTVTPTPTTKPTVTNGTTTTPTISGTATVGSTVTIYDGTTVIGTVVVGSSGTWTYTVTPALPAGSHTITYTVTETGKTQSGKSPAETITVGGTTSTPPGDSGSSSSCGLGGGIAFILFLLAGLRWMTMARFQRKED
jgi:Bacterial Ig-like domain/Putative Ig domain